MNPEKRDLDLQEDVPFQKQVWRVERILWSVMVLIVIAAFLGAFGPGPFSKDVSWDRSSQIKAEYNRIERYQSPTALKLMINPESVVGSETPVVMNRDFVEHIEIKRIDPEPERVQSSGEDFTFYFATSSNQPANVVFHYEPNRFGKMLIRVSVPNGSSLNLEQFYFP